MKSHFSIAAALAALLASSSTLAKPGAAPAYSVIIRGGTIYDGSGGTPYAGDVAPGRGGALQEPAVGRVLADVHVEQVVVEIVIAAEQGQDTLLSSVHPHGVYLHASRSGDTSDRRQA